MGFRFRKTVRFGRLLRLNFSKSGMSVGVGGPFYNVNFSKRRKRTTMGIPGHGVIATGVANRERLLQLRDKW
ncbi:MAG: DUF4236 domain-containing protein [Reyranella sp.]|uniref:DUF4236 domain-containing protein n=1 Tax=Reyranella sp. TaxID=1929291 RepID=UPI001AC57067|nr:DUF4236 domain-containing protein [Reyranella sp.]MBN9089371.1 DUF4236 domain-containing protein [Reyranella sp.]